MCLDCFALFYGDFCMYLFSVDSNEAMKRGDEALNVSSLQFLSSVKPFIAVTFYEKTLFSASSSLLFKRNSSPNTSLPLLFNVTLPTSADYICFDQLTLRL
jgi:hypothetical protein